MKEQSRRKFMRNCGIGLGVALTSNLWLKELIANPSSNQGNFFLSNNFGFSKEDLQKLLSFGLSRGGDFSELFFEYKITNSVVMEEEIIKSASESISLGVGVRVVKGGQYGYGYTNDLTFDKVKEAFITAAAIASGSSSAKVANLNVKNVKNNYYDMNNPISLLNIEPKIELVRKGYDAAKSYDPRISKVSSSIADEIQYITIANSEGLLISDVRPQVRFIVSATAEEGKVRNSGRGNAGGRVGIDFYNNQVTPIQIGRQAAEEAITLLKAKDAPAGEMQIVLSKDESGVMIHEAVGHPLEADGAWKKTSIMWDKLGTQVASPIVTINDDATIPDLRGTLNIDDEGAITKDVMLIENGKLVGFLNDKIGAKMLGHAENGHGRRQTYMHPPIPRMNNTIRQPGDANPDDIIKSVKKGFYAISYQGGMVSGTGKFTFSVNL